MSKLLDPTICPDCRAALDPAATCTACGLALTGPLATRLWQTMTTADTLVEALRRQESVAAPVTSGLPQAPPLPNTGGRRSSRRLSPASVPTLLFATGALCLVVAAVVFVAVAWGSLGLGAKTAILLAVTTGFGAIAGRVTGRELRGAAETFWVVTATLVALDLAAAHGAGLLSFDQLAPRHAIAVTGSVLAALGLGAALLARRTALTFLVSATTASTLGTVLVAEGLAWSGPHRVVGSLLAVLVLVAAAALLLRARLVPAAAGVAGVAGVSWLVLVGEGLARATDAGPGAWWLGAECWPVVTAAVLAGAVTAVPRLTDPLRTGAAATSVFTLVLAVLAPQYSANAVLTVGAALTVVLALAGITLPRSWALATGAFAALGTVGGTMYLLTRPVPGVLSLPGTAPVSDRNLDLVVTVPDPGTAAWTAVAVALAVALSALASLAWIPDRRTRSIATRTWWVLAPTVLALGAAIAVLESEPTLLSAVMAWTATLAVLGAAALIARGSWTPGVLTAVGYLGAVGVRLAVPSHLLVALLATGLVLALAAAHRITASGPVERAVLAGSVVLGAGFAATHWPYLAGGRGDAAGLALVFVAACAALLAAHLTDSGTERVTVEAVALVCGLAATAFPLDDAIRIATLTVTGTVVALISVLHRDRDQVAWLGALVLGVAAVERFDAGLTAPELATAPAAALLLAAGAHRLLRDADVPSLRALGSGLLLAVLPTLVLALDDPVSPRSLVVGTIGALALAIGIERHWAAPFLAGSGVLAVLAIRHLGPVAEAVPRWISLGLMGLALLAVAVTWESRRRDLATAERYLVALR